MPDMPEPFETEIIEPLPSKWELRYIATVMIFGIGVCLGALIYGVVR